MDVEEYKDVNNTAVQPSATVTISDVHSSTYILERSGEYSLAIIQSHAQSRQCWILAFGQIPQIEAQSLYTCRKLISDCAALSPAKYDCCHLRPCVCYFGEYEGYQVCSKVALNVSRSIQASLTKLSHIFHLSQGSVLFLARSSYIR
ncbi:hypothetical protein V1504DRAFT_32804 [Lipomyces starkeyi]